MSVVHLHLVLSHVPVIGLIGVVLLLAVALIKRSDDLARFAFGTAVILGLVAAAVFLTGEAAEESVERLSGISEAVIEAHEEVAAIAIWAAALLGVTGLAVLTFFRKRAVPRGVISTALVASIVVSGIVAWTANLGGRIRHTEIAGVPTAGTAAVERDDD